MRARLLPDVYRRMILMAAAIRLRAASAVAALIPRTGSFNFRKHSLLELAQDSPTSPLPAMNEELKN